MSVNRTIMFRVIPIALKTIKEIRNESGIDVATSNEFFNPMKKKRISMTRMTPVTIPFSSS